MIKHLFKYFHLLIICILFVCCIGNAAKKQNSNLKKQNPVKKITQPKPHDLNEISKLFIKNLTLGDELKGLMADNWTFVYHEDNRESGSTDGSRRNLKVYQVDQPISLQVYNDGTGWFDKKPSKRYKMIFDLKKRVNKWDRLIVTQFGDDLNKNSVYFAGHGESDYIKISCVRVKSKYLIKQLEYRSEDPG